MSAYYSTTNGAHLFQLMGSEKPTGYSGPYVVIDPEDREQVERLREIASRLADDAPYSDGVDSYTDAFAAALREFANPKPPKPEEPTGLGAVVEDTFGHVFIRLSTSWFNINEDQHCTWDHIAAVRILSEGVQS